MENYAELIYLFEQTNQEKGEKLSSFTTHLDKILHQVILKGEMETETASKALLTEVLKGIQPLDRIMS